MSGIAIIDLEGVKAGYELDNESVFGNIVAWNASNPDGLVIIEDIASYSGKAGQSTIDTVKYIGVLEYLLAGAVIDYDTILRWEVKKWVYDTYPAIAKPRIDKRIAVLAKIEARKAAELLEKKNKVWIPPRRNNTFVYVDDRIIIASMKEYWGLATPKPGKCGEYGLSGHSWQALAAGTVYSCTLPLT